jgi:hypothetical protein
MQDSEDTEHPHFKPAIFKAIKAQFALPRVLNSSPTQLTSTRHNDHKTLNLVTALIDLHSFQIE